MLEDSLPGVVVNPNAPFLAILTAVAGATSQPRPNFMYTDDIGESAQWCRNAILEHIKDVKSGSKEDKPAKVSLSRDEALKLMQHIDSCTDLLKG